MASRGQTSCPTPKRPKSNARLRLQVSFPNTERKDLFSARLERTKQHLFPEVGGNVDNYCLLSGLLDCLEGRDIGGIKSMEDCVSEAATSFLVSSG